MRMIIRHVIDEEKLCSFKISCQLTLRLILTGSTLYSAWTGPKEQRRRPWLFLILLVPSEIHEVRACPINRAAVSSHVQAPSSNDPWIFSLYPLSKLMREAIFAPFLQIKKQRHKKVKARELANDRARTPSGRILHALLNGQKHSCHS